MYLWAARAKWFKLQFVTNHLSLKSQIFGLYAFYQKNYSISFGLLLHNYDVKQKGRKEIYIEMVGFKTWSRITPWDRPFWIMFRFSVRQPFPTFQKLTFGDHVWVLLKLEQKKQVN